MTGSSRLHLTVAGCLIGLLLGCGSPDAAEPRTEPTPTTSTSTPPSTSPTPQSVQSVQSLAERCGETDAGQPTTARMIATASGEKVYAVEAGRGPLGVVLVHGSGSRGICNWAKEIGWLAQAGLHVLGYDQSCVGDSTCQGETRPVDDLISVVADLRRRGVTEVAVVGASAGGALPLVAAARPRSGISSVVSLSAVLSAPVGDTMASKVVAGIRAPVMYVLAADDPASSPAELRAFQRRTPGSSQVLLPAGSGHAQALLYDPAGIKPSGFRQTFLAFLRR